ncbi:DExH-box splicing factor binding site-domain-containing protein [Xylariaceae sp. FL1651]|nr:DExH-box splicing factor binding site-domain-containing protein [Xylariaceae sp. FL1651]
MSDSMPRSQAPRIAIRFGASSSTGSKPSSNGIRKPGQYQPSSTLGKRQRPNALHHDSDSGEDENTTGKHEVVTTFGADTISESRDTKVSAAKRTNNEYIISSQNNRDWKAGLRAKGRSKAAPSQVSPKDPNSGAEPSVRDEIIKWGLTLTKNPSQDASTNSGDIRTEHQNEDALGPTVQLNTEDDKSHSPRDVDKDAMDALLGKRNPAGDLVIKDSATTSKLRVSEQDAYQRSMQEAAEISTIEEYSEIPEGEFGAAMLRGMGWKGEEFGTRPKEAKRRPALMGLGSKEDEEIKKAELAKRHGHRERRPRLDEYRRGQEKEKQERNGRYKDSYKSEREHERREQSHDQRQRNHYRDRDGHRHRSGDRRT